LRRLRTQFSPKLFVLQISVSAQISAGSLYRLCRD
jgi:hypothetical protein